MAGEKPNNFVLKALNIRPDESWAVKNLFLHYFFQGFGVALFYTVANALFLTYFQIDKLAQVYIYSALALLLTGRLYAWLEHKLSVKMLLYLVMAGLTVSALASRLGLVWLSGASFIAVVLMVLYRVVYLLSSLEFWGLSAILFDVRQSKRLFALISAGDRPAKLLGYLSVIIIEQFFSSDLINDLLEISSLSFIISFFFLRRIMASPKTRELTEKEDHEEHEQQPQESQDANLLKKIFGNEFIGTLALLSLIVMASLSFVEFSFLSEVKTNYKKEDELVVFIAFFYAVENTITILSKFFLTGRLINRIGMRISLLTLPVSVLIVAVSMIVSAQFLGSRGDQIAALWFFSIMMLVANIFKTILHDPVFLSLFQPLTRELRLHGHTIVKGFMDPIGLGLAGLILLIDLELFHSINLYFVDYGVIGALIIWIGLVMLSYKKYVEALGTAIQKHFIEGSEITIKDEDTIRTLRAKLKSELPEEVIYSYELLQKIDPDDLEEITIELLYHPSYEVKLHSLDRIEEYAIDQADEPIIQIIYGEEYPSWLKEKAIKTYCTVDEDALDTMLSQLESGDEHIRKGAITGLLQSGGVEAIVLAGQQLLRLIQSEELNDRILATSIIGDLGIRNFYKPIIQFLEDPQTPPELKAIAIEASGKIGNERLLPYLIPYLNDRNYSEKALAALEQFGERVLEIFRQRVQHRNISDRNQMLKFLHLCGRIRTQASIETLKAFLNNPEVKVRDEALNSLRLAGYKAKAPHEEAFFHQKLDEQFELAYVLSIYQRIVQESTQDLDLLGEALEIEFRKVISRIFSVLSFLYPARSINQAREALQIEDKEKQANALEVLENTVTQRLLPKLIPILDNLTLQERIEKFEKHYPRKHLGYKNLLEDVLIHSSRQYNRWTQAVALYTLQPRKEFIPLVSRYLECGVKILEENAAYALRKLDSNSLSDFWAKMEGADSDQIARWHMKTYQQPDASLMEIEKIVILKGTSMFVNTPDNILIDVAGIVKEERFSAGHTIFNKGDFGSSMYIIYEGGVKIHDGDVVFAELKNRDFFGELALLDPEPRSASATATKDSLLLRIDQNAFFELMSERSEVGLGILKTLCQRLRNQNTTITQLKSKIAAPADE